jgi:hypothetical protein
MNLETDRSNKNSRIRRYLGNLGWVLAGVVLTVLLVANPLRLHPLDAWLHRLVSR